MACGCGGGCGPCKRRGGQTRKRKQSGGYLTGPSHEQGGIPATFQNGGEMIELEGGEYIINAQTVNAVGTEFLDKLNSTATTYHQGGYEQGQLPNPSNYKRGGKVVSKKRRGGKIKKQTGGTVVNYNSNSNGVRTNLHTRGGEYVCQNTPNYPGCGMGENGTYIGPMHFHPNKGFMAGAVHDSINPHPLLTPLPRVNRTTPSMARNMNRRRRGGKVITKKQHGGMVQSSTDCAHNTIWNGVTCIPIY